MTAAAACNSFLLFSWSTWQGAVQKPVDVFLDCSLSLFVGHALYACRQPNDMGNAENSPIEVEFSDGTHAMRALRIWFKQYDKLQFEDQCLICLPQKLLQGRVFPDPEIDKYRHLL